MDAVILAAGKGSRLDGIVPPYFKPLLVMDGKSLVRRCVDDAMSVGAENIVVVVAPENAQAVASVLRGPGLGIVQLIVQNTPMGPGHALKIGLKLVRDDADVLVLMGDNFISHEDVRAVVKQRPSIGIRHMTEGISRFTYLDEAKGQWVEKVPPSVEGARYAAWCGPICIAKDDLSQALNRLHAVRDRGELTIGESFNLLNHEPENVIVRSIDIGVPEALA